MVRFLAHPVVSIMQLSKRNRDTLLWRYFRQILSVFKISFSLLERLLNFQQNNTALPTTPKICCRTTSRICGIRITDVNYLLTYLIHHTSTWTYWATITILLEYVCVSPCFLPYTGIYSLLSKEHLNKLFPIDDSKKFWMYRKRLGQEMKRLVWDLRIWRNITSRYRFGIEGWLLRSRLSLMI